MEILYIALLVIGLIAFYAIGTILNKRTPIPEGCELPSLACESCSSGSCSYSEPNRLEMIKAEIKESLKKNTGGEGGVNEYTN